jgi:hypothetical protein
VHRRRSYGLREVQAQQNDQAQITPTRRGQVLQGGAQDGWDTKPWRESCCSLNSRSRVSTFQTESGDSSGGTRFLKHSSGANAIQRTGPRLPA